METNEENKIQEAEVFPEEKAKEVLAENRKSISDDSNEEVLAKKRRSEVRSRMVLIFLLGFLIGVAIKTEALKKITIGYNDYLMEIKPQSYDINQVQQTLQKEREETARVEEQGVPDPESGAVSEGMDEQGTVSEQPEN
jgi:hypothetical protein